MASGALSDTAPPVGLLVLCTGNAARSVMAGFMLGYLAEANGVGIDVSTAGTHVVDGQPMSARTRTALSSVGALEGIDTSRHRSRQVRESDLERTDLVIAMEADHVRYVRRRHPDAAARTATIRRLCRDLPAGPAGLPARVAALDLGGVVLTDSEDVADPAGGDEAAYVACAHELFSLCQELIVRL
ncbi:MAG: arsenate reductase/protein-tyrosine-phosphatase family protein [Acidimicrobiales bacterium]